MNTLAPATALSCRQAFALFSAVTALLASSVSAATLYVQNAADFNALPTLNAGDVVILHDGVYGALEKTLLSSIADDATALSNPIYVTAVSPGGVKVAAPSRIVLRGRGIVLAGIDFGPGSGMADNGGTSPAWIIRTDINSRHMTMSHVRFDGCTAGDNYGNWILVSGFNHVIEYCSFTGQNEPVAGATLSLVRSVAEAGVDTPRNHIVRHNYFGPRECSVSDNGYETIRIGDSGSQAHDMGVVIERNVFYRSIWRSDGARPNEPEIISNKSRGNIIRHNTFLESFGQITLRHGDSCIVEGNFVFGGGYYDGSSIALSAAENTAQSGVRVSGQHHIVRNNYFVNLRGTGEHAAFSAVAGYPDFNDGNGSGGDATYEAAHHLQLHHNTFIDCRELRLGVRSRVESSEQPVGITIHNNAWQGSGISNGVAVDPEFVPGDSAGNYVFHPTASFGWMGLEGTYSSTASTLITEPYQHYLIPSAESPLLNAASEALLVSDDIRGALRPGIARDIGSFELEASGGDNRPLLRDEVGAAFDGGPGETYPEPPGFPLTVLSTSLPNAKLARSYTASLQAFGGTAPVVWSLVNGMMPSGLQLTPGGVITGTPTALGSSDFEVQLTDGTNTSINRWFTLTVIENHEPAIITNSLPAGEAGSPYAQSIEADSEDTVVGWSVVAGALPPGLVLSDTMSQTALLSGIPTVSGAFEFALRVVDIDGDDATRAFVLTLAQFAPAIPVITVQPVARNAAVDAVVTFAVEAAGVAPLSYQWSKDGVELPGATSSVLTIAGVATTDAGSYSLRVTNPNGSVSSDAVALTVTIAGEQVFLTDTLADNERLIQDLPESARWLGNNSSALTVADEALTIAPNANGLAYFTDGPPRALAVGESLQAAFTIVFDGSSLPTGNDVFRVALLNSHGTATDRNATSVANRVGTDGYGSATLALRNNSGYMAGAALSPTSANGLRFFARNYEASSTLTGTASYTTLGPLSGSGGFGFTAGVPYECTFTVYRATETTAVLTLMFQGAFATGGTGTWSHTLTDSTGQPTHTFDMLAFYVGTGTGMTGGRVDNIRIGAGSPATTPAITLQPASQIAGIGGVVTFTSAAIGDPAPTFKWQMNGADIPGATGPSLTLTGIASSDAGNYTMVATNAAGSVSSNPAVLAVYDPSVPALAFGGTELVMASQNMRGLSGGSVVFNDQTPISPSSGYAGPVFYGGAFVAGGASIDQWNVFNDATNGDSLRFRMSGPPQNASSVGLFLWKREDFASPYDTTAPVNLSTGDASLSFTGRRFGTAVGGELRFVVQAAEGAHYISNSLGTVPATFATVTLADPLVGADWYPYTPETDTIGAIAALPDFTSILAAGVRLQIVKTNSDGGAITAALSAFTVVGGSSVPTILNERTLFAVAGQPFELAISATNFPTSFEFGSLPGGLVANTATGVITGIPTTPGFFSTSVQAFNGSGAGPAVALEFSIATPSAAVIPGDGLVANYEFSGNANDLARNRAGENHGAMLTADRFGRAASAFLFDGTNDYIEVADDDDYSVPATGELAISVWIKPVTLNFPVFDSTGYVHYLGKGEPGNHEWTFRMYNEVTTDIPPRPNRTSFYLFDLDGGKGNGTYVQEPVTANEWIHLVAVSKTGPESDYPSSNYIKWYKNGSLVDTKPIDGSPFPGIIPANGAAPMRIGTRNLTSYFQGAIDDIRIYNRVLSATEVQILHVENPQSTGTNQPPTDLSLSSTSLERSSATAGAVVAALSTVDADANDVHAYSFAAGAGANDNALFTISGEVLGIGPVALGAGNHSVRIRSTDAGGLFVEKQFTIAVIDTTPMPPAIVAQPQAQASIEGGSAAFSATVSGYPAPSLQWRKSGDDLVGATGASLTLANVAMADAGDYTLVATNAHGTVTSDLARLVVYAPSARAVAFGGADLVAANQNMVRLAAGSVAFSELSPIVPATGYAGPNIYGGAFISNGGVLDQWNIFNDTVNGDSLRFRMFAPPLNATSTGLFLWKREDFGSPHNMGTPVNLGGSDSVLTYTGRRFGSEIQSELRFVLQAAPGVYYVSEPQGGGIPLDFGTVTLIDPAGSAQWYPYSPGNDMIDVNPATPDFSSIRAAGVRLQVTKSGSGGGNITVALSGFSVVVGSGKLVPSLVWPQPVAISHGQPLSATELNANAIGPDGSSIPGTFEYAPPLGTVLNAGENRTLSVTFNPTGGAASLYESVTATTVISVTKASPAIAWSAPAAIDYGTPLSEAQLSATAAGVNGSTISGTFTYAPAIGTVLDAGAELDLTVTFTPTGADADNYETALGATTITVNKVIPRIVWAAPEAVVYGTPLSATQLNATATGVDGASVSGTFNYTPTTGAVLAAGANQLLSVEFAPSETDVGNYENASAETTITILPAPVTITLGNLNQRYDGTSKPVHFTTAPAGASVSITYNGQAEPPIYPGKYTIVATADSDNYSGSATGELTISISALVRHAPNINGGLDGSLQVLLPENLTVNGNGWVSGDLLVPGMPTLSLNGQPLYAGVLEGFGSQTPANHRMTLNGGAVLRYLVRRIDAIAMPAVVAPPAPPGTRNVVLNTAGASAGDFSTLRNLTLNGGAGNVVIPPGTYGSFIANGSSGFTLGTPDSTEPTVYNLQSLTLNGGTSLNVVGPVVVVVAQGLTINGTAGASAQPAWLTLRIASGGVTLNSNATLHGDVTAPSGTVTINHAAELNGAITADRLTIATGGRLTDPEP